MNNSSSNALTSNVSVDCVVFGFDNEQLNVLLLEQNLDDPNKSQYALPGNLILENESLDDAANRVLYELTHVQGIFLEQFKAFGDPYRVSDTKDREWLQRHREKPTERVITVAYFALIRMEDVEVEASSFARKVFWQEIHEVPDLAFDHNLIVEEALDRLRRDFENNNTGFELLPETFTLSQVQRLYEIILDRKLDKRNFRKKILKEKLVHATDEKQQGVLHKPARLYRLNEDNEE